MGSTKELLDEFLEKEMFNCAHCKNMLKVPVMLVENIGNVCCSCYNEIKDDNVVALENTLVTELLEKMTFPCKYKSQGCIEKIQYKQYQEHLDQCIFESFRCKAPISCFWNGTLKDFIFHFRMNHKEHHLKSKDDCFMLDDDFEKLTQGVYLLETSYGDFFLNIIKTDHDMKFLIYQITEAMNDLEYNFFVTFVGQATEFSSLNCQLTDWKSFDNPKQNKYSNISLELLNCISKNDCIARVQITLKVKDQFETIEDSLLEIVCEHCKSYLIRDNIYFCYRGHHCCKNCKSKFQCCSAYAIHNEALENIFEKVSLPCKYKNKGCPVKVRANINHDYSCYYKDWKCYLEEKCNYIGPLTTYIDHIQTHHRTWVVFFNELFTLNHRKDWTGSYHLTVDNLLFILHYKNNINTSQKSSLWSMDVIGHNGLQNYYKYYFEIEFKRGDRCMIYRALCTHQVVMSKNTGNQETMPNLETTNIIDITSDMLKHISDRDSELYYYEVRILKIHNDYISKEKERLTDSMVNGLDPVTLDFQYGANFQIFKRCDNSKLILEKLKILQENQI